LVKSESFTTGGEDTSLGTFCKPQSRDGKFGNGGQANVIRYCTDLDNNLGREVGGVGGFFYDA
jgi:hypothetical protein